MQKVKDGVQVYGDNNGVWWLSKAPRGKFVATHGGATSAWSPVLAMKSVAGKWEIGTHTDDLYVNYYLDTRTSNGADKQYRFAANGNITTPGSITASAFVKTGSSSSYVLLGDGSHKALTDFAMAHTHPYWPISYINSNKFSTRSNGSWGNQTGMPLAYWDETNGGGLGFRYDNPSSGKLSMVIDGTVYVNEGTYAVLHTGNSSVSKSGQTLTVKINDTTQSLTNTDSAVYQSSSSSADWRDLLLSYYSVTTDNVNISVSAATAQTYFGAGIAAQTSTGSIYAKGSYYGKESRFHNCLAYYNSTASQAVGAIVIQLPNSWNSTMICYEIDVYEYNFKGASKIICGGYNYTSSSSWVNTSVTVIGDYSFNVRFGYYNNKCCIILGAVDTTWSYPQVWLKSVETGFNHQTFWKGEYTISLITDNSLLTSINAPTVKRVAYQSQFAGLFTNLSNTSDNKISVTIGGTNKTLTVGYATNADTLDGIHASGLFTNLSNSGNNISVTIGGTNKTLTVGYATNADTVDGIHANGLFTNLSNSGNNISVTIGGTNKTLTVGYASSAGNADTVDSYHASSFVKRYTLKYPATTTEDTWYTLFTISDYDHGSVLVIYRAYAHSSLTFTVSKGYTTNGTITILNYNSGGNGAYPYIKKVRLLSGGEVQALINKFTINISPAMVIVSPSDVTVNTNLTAYSGTPTVIQEVAPTHGMMSAHGFIKKDSSDSYVLLGGGGHKLESSLSVANADTLDGIHASGLFTDLSNSGNNISVAVGGVRKTLTVGYATNSTNWRRTWSRGNNTTIELSGNNSVTNVYMCDANTQNRPDNQDGFMITHSWDWGGHGAALYQSMADGRLYVRASLNGAGDKSSWLDWTKSLLQVILLIIIGLMLKYQRRHLLQQHLHSDLHMR